MHSQPVTHDHVQDEMAYFVHLLPTCVILIVVLSAITLSLGHLYERSVKRRAARFEQDQLNSFIDGRRRAQRMNDVVIDAEPVDPNDWMRTTGPIPFVAPVDGTGAYVNVTVTDEPMPEGARA